MKFFNTPALSVDSIMSSFTKAIQELEIVEQRELDKKVAITAQIEQALADKEKADMEGQRASSVKAKLLALVG
jgi:hypothetical protein